MFVGVDQHDRIWTKSDFTLTFIGDLLAVSSRLDAVKGHCDRLGNTCNWYKRINSGDCASRWFGEWGRSSVG